jgi:hypothetical protein
MLQIDAKSGLHRKKMNYNSKNNLENHWPLMTFVIPHVYTKFGIS